MPKTGVPLFALALMVNIIGWDRIGIFENTSWIIGAGASCGEENMIPQFFTFDPLRTVCDVTLKILFSKIHRRLP